MTLCRSFTILNVDDNEAGRYAKSRILQHAGYRVVEAETGAAALRLAAEIRPELVLLDIKLPDLDGFEVCDRIKNDPVTAEAMVLQISAVPVTTADRVKSLETGADACLTEPIEPEDLIATVRALLRLHERERENRRLLAELAESEGQFRAFFESASVGMCQSESFTGRLLRVNRRYCEILGYSEAELLGRTFADITHPEDREENLRGFMAMSRGEISDYRTEKRYIRKDGGIVWVELTANQINAADGKPRRTMTVVQDITQRKQAEAARRESEQRFRELANLMPQIVFTAAPSGQLDFINNQWMAFTGDDEKRAIAEGFDALIHPDDVDSVRHSWRVSVESGTPGESEFRLRGRDGLYRWLLHRTVPQKDEHNQIIKWIGTSTDIDSSKRLHEALRESEERLRLAVQAGRFGTYDWDLEKNEIYCSPELRAICGLSRSEPFTKQVAVNLIHPEDRAGALERIRRGLANGGQYEAEFRVIRPDGELRWVIVRGRGYVARDKGQKQPVRGLGTITDITARKRNEAQLRVQNERLQILAETAERLLVAGDYTAMMRGVFATLQQHLGLDGYLSYNVDQTGSALVLDHSAGIAEDIAPLYQRLAFGEGYCGTVAQTRAPAVVERLQERSDPKAALAKQAGFRAYVCHPLLVGDRLLGTLSFASKHRESFDPDEIESIRTICHYVAMAKERQRLLDQAREHADRLAKNELRLQLGLDTMNVGIYDWQLQSVEAIWDDRLRAHWGIKPGAPITYDMFMEGIHVDDRPALQAAMEPALDPTGVGRFYGEFRVIGRDDGVERWISTRGQVFCENGRPVRLVGATFDRTERKREELELMSLRDRLALELTDMTRLHDLSTVLLLEDDLNATLDRVLEACMQLLGTDKGSVQLYDPEERCLKIVAQHGFDVAFMEHFKTVDMDSGSSCGAALRRGERVVIEDLSGETECAELAEFLGRYGVFAVQSTPIYSQGGKILGMISTHFATPHRPSDREMRLLDLYAQQAQRVIERKQAENALRESEERLALALEASHSGVWDLDLTTGKATVSPSFRALHGFSAGESITYDRWLLRVRRQDRKRLARYREEMLRSGTDFNFEYRIQHPDSGERWLCAMGRMVRNAEGAPARLIGVTSDITARKRAEVARAQLAAIVESSDDAIISTDLTGLITSWNRGAERLYGYNAAEIIGQPVSMLICSERQEEEMAIFRRVTQGEAIDNYETRRRRKDGSEFDVALTVSPIKNDRGTIIGTSKIARDISARIIAEETLWRSEEQLRLAQNAASVGIWDWDPITDKLSWTAEMLNLYGVAQPIQHYEEWRQLVHVDDLPRIEAEREEWIRNRGFFNIEYRILHSSGEVRWISSRGQGWYDEDGRLVRVLGINMDVTERKRAEMERLKFEVLVESNIDYIGMADAAGNSIYLNPAGRALIGAERIEEIKEHRAVDFVADEWKEFFRDSVLPELVTRGKWEGELPLKHQRTGASIDAYRTFFLVKDPATGNPMCIANVARDIRERKRAEAELRESEQRFRALADSAPVLIWISGPEGAQFCNQAYRDFVGVADDAELVGLGWMKYLHPDDREAYMGAYLKVLEQRGRFERDFRMRRADGEYRWMKSLAMPRFNAGGEAVNYAGCTIDVHDAKLAEAQLALLAAVVNSSQDAIYSFTLDTTIISWNRAAEALFGWTEAEVLGRLWSNFLPSNLKAQLAEIVTMVESGNSVTRFETTGLRKDGSSFDVSLTFSPVVAQDKIIAVSAIARDITESKRAEEQREQQARLLDLSLDAIIVWRSADGAIEYWNEGAEKLYGYTAGEVMGCSVADLLKPGLPMSRVEIERKIYEDGEWDGRLVHAQKSGGRVAVLSRMQRIVRPQGDAVLEVNRDITIVEEAEQAVAEASAHVKAIVETAVDGIISIDEQGIIESFNLAAEKIFNYAAGDIMGKGIDWLMPELAARFGEGGIADYLKTAGQPTIGSGAETRGRRADGSEFPVDFGLSESIVGESRFYTVLVRDATARKEAERALVEAKNAADAANRAKSEFLANMSHEIRNPMTGIMGYADILLARLEDRGAIECVRTIKDSGQYLLQIINDLLDLAKIEAQGLELEKEEIHLPTFLTDVYTLMEGAARAKGLPLSLKYDGVIPYEIDSDPKRLRQILINLLGNAIKFTDRGGVELAVHFDVDRGELQFHVSDSGIGMTQEQQRNLFTPFAQGDSSMTKTYGGTGLGLAITKRLVEALEGDIGVDSVPGRGSTFHVTLPVRVLSGSAYRDIELAPKIPLLAGQQMTGLRVMIVEDQPDIRRLMEYFLAAAGASVTTFSGGEAAVLAVEQRPDDFDVILMDIQMPRLDGYHTTRQIRALGFTRPIIAVTAGAMATDQANCFAAGCSDYVSKPIDMAMLLETIARAASVQQVITRREQWRQPGLWEDPARNGPFTEINMAENERRRVLVVDDRPVALNATKSLLEMRGFEVRTAATGHAAIRIGPEFRPHYIFLDISLPDISGYEVFRRLKSSEQLPNTKFIALSGHGREESLRARKAGFDAYMTKPVDIREMEKLIRGSAETATDRQ